MVLFVRHHHREAASVALALANEMPGGGGPAAVESGEDAGEPVSRSARYLATLLDLKHQALEGPELGCELHHFGEWVFAARHHRLSQGGEIGGVGVACPIELGGCGWAARDRA